MIRDDFAAKMWAGKPPEKTAVMYYMVVLRHSDPSRLIRREKHKAKAVWDLTESWVRAGYTVTVEPV
jgi:hypothetical protein